MIDRIRQVGHSPAIQEWGGYEKYQYQTYVEMKYLAVFINWRSQSSIKIQVVCSQA